MSVPARLFALLPREGRRGVVLRRGPSSATAMLSWDLRADAFEVGQWLRGYAYGRRCDLSSDGRYMIAALAKHGGRLGPGGYTIVCRPPFFTALAFHGAGHCWNGGGVFLDARRYWLDASGPPWSGPDTSVASPLLRVPSRPPGLVAGMGEDLVLYPQRLVRDGWTLTSDHHEDRTRRMAFARPVRPHWTLRKTVTASSVLHGPNGEAFWETHEIEGPNGTTALDDEWAEVDRHDIVFARGGCLWRMRVHAKRSDEATCLIDTDSLTPSPRLAPYHGVQRTVTP